MLPLTILLLSACTGGTPAPNVVCDPVEQGLEYCYRSDAPDRGRFNKVEAAICDAPTNLVECDTTAGVNAMDECLNSAECGGGTCGQIYCGCSCADTCASDADCGAGQLCACPGPGFPSQEQICLDVGCTSADDCGGFECGVASDGCGWGHLWGAFCRTANDSCEFDSDCEDAERCTFVDDQWACREPAICDC